MLVWFNVRIQCYHWFESCKQPVADVTAVSRMNILAGEYEELEVLATPSPMTTTQVQRERTLPDLQLSIGQQ